MIFCNRCGGYAVGRVSSCPKCGADLAVTGHETLVGGAIATSSSQSSGGSEPPGHVQRVVALFIDGLLVGLICGVGFGVTVLIGDTLGLLVIGLVLIVAIAYEPYFIAAKGATPGKSSMGLQVVTVDGGPVSTGQSIARWLLKGILNGFVIPMFVPLFNEKRQGLHDMIVGTLVVKV